MGAVVTLKIRSPDRGKWAKFAFSNSELSSLFSQRFSFPQTPVLLALGLLAFISFLSSFLSFSSFLPPSPFLLLLLYRQEST